MGSRSKKTMLAVAVLGLLALAAEPAKADLPGFTLDNLTGSLLANPPFTLGFQFTANQAVTVTALGVFDDSQNGLVDSHQIGLWNSSGVLLASTSVVSGTTDPLTNQFRYADITATTLTAGQTYTVGALYVDDKDPLLFPGSVTGFATNAAITFDQNAYVVGSNLTNPTSTSGGGPSYFGPNFLFSGVQPVPEPSTLAVGLLGGLGMIGYAWRRRKAAME